VAGVHATTTSALHATIRGSGGRFAPIQQMLGFRRKPSVSASLQQDVEEDSQGNDGDGDVNATRRRPSGSELEAPASPTKRHYILHITNTHDGDKDMV
jgi:hypothetical protein